MAKLPGIVEAESEMLRGMSNSWFKNLNLQDGMEHYTQVSGAPVDEQSYQAAWMEGRAMQLEQAIEYALSQTSS